MKTVYCNCGNTLFFDSTTCLKCSADTGICPVCNCMTDLPSEKPIALKCGRSQCGAALKRCPNFVENGCNRCTTVENVTSGTICDYCQTTTVIPDLAVEGNREKWTQLEAAKRRVLAILDELRLPFRAEAVSNGPDLSFEFRADAAGNVRTGHENGRITINIREADDVEREVARVSFQEPQRTLVGHFRHELGHYYWEVLVKGEREGDFRSVFGDERNPDYATSLQTYHSNGPPSGWQVEYISGYATMHPWEDFAETFGAYLDMVTVLKTAQHFGIADPFPSDADELIRQYQRVGLVANELNRDMGLIDLVPEVIQPPVVRKLKFIHQLIEP